MFRIFSFILCFTYLFQAWSQSEPIEIIHSDQLEFMNRQGKEIKKLSGHVHLKSQGSDFYCDSAFLVNQDQDIEAYSHIKLIQGDSLELTADKAEYQSQYKKLIAEGKPVVLRQKTMTLTSPSIEFSLKEKMASFNKGGKLMNDTFYLSSKSGIYYTKQKRAVFTQNVYLKNKDFKLYTDSLWYDEKKNISSYKGGGIIYTETDTIRSLKGSMNTNNSEGYLSGKVRRHGPDGFLEADSISIYENQTRTDFFGDVYFYSAKDSLYVKADKGYSLKDGVEIYMTGKTKTLQISDDDSLFIIADTVYSKKDSISNQQTISAWGHQSIYRNDLQSISDSMVWSDIDSQIRLYRNAFVWSDSIQIQSAYLIIQLNQKKPKWMKGYLYSKVMIKEKGLHYNQLTGDSMQSEFQHGDLSSMNMFGHVLSLYYLKDDLNRYTGINRLEAPEMHISIENKKVKSLQTIGGTQAKVLSPEPYSKNPPRLQGLSWQEKIRPQKQRWIVHL